MQITGRNSNQRACIGACGPRATLISVKFYGHKDQQLEKFLMWRVVAESHWKVAKKFQKARELYLFFPYMWATCCFVRCHFR